MPAVRLAIVELLPPRVRDVYGLRRTRTMAIAARLMFMISRIVHRMRWRRSAGMVDFGDLARTARQMRERIEREPGSGER